ncbi:MULTISPECIES: FAD-dependent oxidoreductase [unclassified Nonomuraea]|uniref:FAD-dependent oxidoreductase n=1 Tax=unclassified Nonomuraea TaxID=2593643 RepID=UPI0033E823F0
MPKPRIVVVGAGFGGYHCLRGLERLLPPGAAELVLVSRTDYHLYTPLLPQVAAGTVNPADVAVPLRSLRRTRLRTGQVTGADLGSRTVTVRHHDGGLSTLSWDRLVLAPGSVTRVRDVPGLREYAHGFKTVIEAVYLRDRVLAQLERADGLPDGPERQACPTFVVVGAGLAGTEYVARRLGAQRPARPQHGQPRPGPRRRCRARPRRAARHRPAARSLSRPLAELRRNSSNSMYCGVMNAVDLFLLGRTLMKIGEEAMPTEGIGPQTTSVRTVLIVVSDVRSHPDTSVGEIVARTGLPQSAVSASVARLREAGAVVTEPDPRDRRRTVIRHAPKLSDRVAEVRAAPIEPALALALGGAEPAGHDEVTEVTALLEALAARLTPDSLARLRPSV